MQQAALSDCPGFDRLSHFQDFSPASVINVGRGQVSQALMVPMVVVVIDEGADLPLEIAGQEVVFQQDAVLQRLMPAFDLALGLGVMRRATDVVDALVVEILGQIGCDV